ncbi:hypothetical protein [Geodermatophilus sp. URMC 63]
MDGVRHPDARWSRHDLPPAEHPAGSRSGHDRVRRAVRAAEDSGTGRPGPHDHDAAPGRPARDDGGAEDHGALRHGHGVGAGGAHPFDDPGTRLDAGARGPSGDRDGRHGPDR